MSHEEFRGSTLLAAVTALALAVSGPSPARADRCDDIAKELAEQIEGLKVNLNAPGIVYLTHPQAKELTLGCRGDKYSHELYAKAEPHAETGILPAGRQRRRRSCFRDQGRHHDRRHPLPQADGPLRGDKCEDSLPPPQPGMHPHQDGGCDRDQPRQGRMNAGAREPTRGPEKFNGIWSRPFAMARDWPGWPAIRGSNSQNIRHKPATVGDTKVEDVIR